MFRPIIWVAAAFAAGIVVGRGSALTAWAWLAASCLCGLVAWACLAAGRLAVIPLLLGTVAAGALWHALHAVPPAAEALTAAFGEDVTLTGAVVRPPRVVEGSARAVVSVERVHARGRSAAARGLIQVSLRDSALVRYGDRIVVTGRLVRPPPAGNPGEFSYRDYLAARGIAGVLYARRGTSPRVIGRIRVNPLIAAAASVRGKMTAFFRTALPGRRGALMASLLLGDDGALEPGAKDIFARSGLLHVLVVSGAQVGLVLASVLWLGRALRAPPAGAAAAAAMMTVFFALMAGWVPSVARAAVMALAGVAAPALRRSRDVYAALALAALALLVAQPLLLFDAGFQLSFAATWALIYVAPVLAPRLEALPPPVRALVSMTVAAQIGVAPILAYHFLQISLAGVLANLLVIPLVALLVPAGFVTALLGVVIPSAGAVAAILLALPADAVWWTARAFAWLPFAAVPVDPPSLLGIVVCYGVLAAAVEWLRGRFRVTPAAVSIVVSAAVAVVLWAHALAAAAPAYLVVTFLDVGQGDAIVARAPSGRTMLVDAGGEVEGHITGYDVGARRVVPALRRLRVRRIDVVIVSHPHEDHVGGLPAVLENFPVGLVLDGGFEHPAPSYARVRRLIAARHAPYRLARRGQRVDLGAGTAVVILNPAGVFVTGSGSDVNANSIVARLAYGQASVLLTGDIEALTEAMLLSDGDNLRSTVLKVAHHGSATSSTPAFLDAVAPRVAVISVGSPNPFGHPHRATLDGLHAAGAAVYRTDRSGAITLTTDGVRVWVRPTREEHLW